MVKSKTVFLQSYKIQSKIINNKKSNTMMRTLFLQEDSAANQSREVNVNRHLENGTHCITAKKSERRWTLNRLQMAQYIWIGLLNISLLCLTCGHIAAQKPSPSFYADLEGNKKAFFAKGEVNVLSYRGMLADIKKEYGEDSEQYRRLIPDTAKFRAWYGIPFVFSDKGSSETMEFIEQYPVLPMVAISYEQALAFCQWAETSVNKHRNSKYVWRFSLPEKADYEMALTKAKITQQESLSPLQAKERRNCHKIKDGTECVIRSRYDAIYGLTDNVAEYMQDGMTVEGGKNAVLKFSEAKDSENPTGFRCKITLVAKDK
jgi:hypothetical protein